jgi:hypothetical protein
LIYDSKVHDGVSTEELTEIVDGIGKTLGANEDARYFNNALMETFATGMVRMQMPISVGVCLEDVQEDIKPETKRGYLRIFRREKKKPAEFSCSNIISQLHTDIQPGKEYLAFSRKLQSLFDNLPKDKHPDIIEFKEYADYEIKEAIKRGSQDVLDTALKQESTRKLFGRS